MKQLTEGFKFVFTADQIISRVTQKHFSTRLKTQKRLLWNIRV